MHCDLKQDILEPGGGKQMEGFLIATAVSLAAWCAGWFVSGLIAWRRFRRCLHWLNSPQELRGALPRGVPKRISALLDQSAQTVAPVQLTAVVEERTRELNNAYVELERQNRKLLDSLQYAQLIQRSILPKEQQLGAFLRSSWIYWQPLDLVGGDFYWFYSNRDYCLIAVGDCTGHGVPGAFMTMTANSVLNHIVEYRDDNPAEILSEMNAIMRATLHHDGRQVLTDDGLDIGLCFYRLGAPEMVFAGARISLFVWDGETTTRFRGDRQGIGYVRSREEFWYTNRSVPVTPESRFYLSTDGLFDQNGGTKNLPYGYSRFCRFIRDHAAEPFDRQLELLGRETAGYMQQCGQRDDICVWGFMPKTAPAPDGMPGDSKVVAEH